MEFDRILQEFQNIEMNMSKIYTAFRHLFPEDAGFWWTLSQEELNHASLILSLRQAFAPLGKYPSFVQNLNFNTVLTHSSEIKKFLKSLENSVLTREGSFKMAYKLENLLIEQHYQEFMENNETDEFDKIFQKLNNFDKDHAKRVLKYAHELGIVL